MLGLGISPKPVDTNKSFQMQKRIVQEFRQQLMIGKPNNADELGLKSIGQDGTEGKLLTHVVFHPVQKSLNRLLQIDYTIRVQSLTGFTEI